MSKNVIYNLFYLVLLTINSSCYQDDSTENLNGNINCENETVKDTISEVRGKIVKVDGVYSITTDSESLEENGYIIGSENILVPYDLEEKYKNEELQVILSGYKISCCGLLSLPQIRNGFGCKFEITSIKPF